MCAHTSRCIACVCTLVRACTRRFKELERAIKSAKASGSPSSPAAPGLVLGVGRKTGKKDSSKAGEPAPAASAAARSSKPAPDKRGGAESLESERSPPRTKRQADTRARRDRKGTPSHASQTADAWLSRSGVSANGVCERLCFPTAVRLRGGRRLCGVGAQQGGVLSGRSLGGG